MGACCSRRSNKIAAERQALKEAVSSEVHGLMDQHHRLIATTEQGSIVRLSNGTWLSHPERFRESIMAKLAGRSLPPLPAPPTSSQHGRPAT